MQNHISIICSNESCYSVMWLCNKFKRSEFVLYAWKSTSSFSTAQGNSAWHALHVKLLWWLNSWLFESQSWSPVYIGGTPHISTYVLFLSGYCRPSSHSDHAECEWILYLYDQIIHIDSFDMSWASQKWQFIEFVQYRHWGLISAFTEICPINI